MAVCPDICLAGAAGAESGAVGLALGDGPLILNADVGGAAAAVDGVVLAAGDVAADAGIGLAGFLSLMG